MRVRMWRMLASFSFSPEVHKELLKLVTLHDANKGKDIFYAINSVSEHGDFEKLSVVVTDSAPSMQGRCTRFSGLLRQSDIDCPILHCIIHQVGNVNAG